MQSPVGQGGQPAGLSVEGDAAGIEGTHRRPGQHASLGPDEAHVGLHLAPGRASQGAGPVHQPLSVTVEQGPGTGDHPVPVPVEGLLRSNQLLAGQTADRLAGLGHALPVLAGQAGQLLTALGGGDERAVGHLVGHRLVAGVPDSGPDRSVGVGDGPGHRLGVERGQVGLGPTAPHHHEHVTPSGLEPADGRGHRPGRPATLYLGGNDLDGEGQARGLELSR